MYLSGACFCLLYFSVVCIRGIIGSGNIPDYYWRDYNGHIPDDALPGGNENGRLTYIGQIIYKELITPAKIIPQEKTAYFEWGHAGHSTTKNIKIFCTNHPEKFVWIKSSNEDFKKIENTQFIGVGYEPNSVLYIGRAYLDNEIVLGKLLVNDASVLHVSRGASGWSVYVYEVLTYDDTQGNTEAVSLSKCKKRPLVVNFYC